MSWRNGLLDAENFWKNFDAAGFPGIPESLVTNYGTPDVGFVRDWVNYMGPITQGNLAFHLGIGLCLISATIPAHIKTPDGDAHPGNFFCMLVGPSSWAKKTFAVSKGEDLITAVKKEKLISIDTASAEGLTEEIVRYSQGRISMIPEGATFLSHTANDYGAKVRHLLNKVFDGKPIAARLTVTSKKTQKGAPSEPTIAEAPRMSIAMACTPRHMQEYTYALDWEAGFMSRFCVLLAMPERILNEAGMNPAMWDLLVRRYNNANNLPPVAECVGYTEEAKAYWKAWQAVYIPPRGSLNEFLSGIVDRAQAVAKRAALALAWARHIDAYITSDGSNLPEVTSRLLEPWLITLNDMQVGCAIATMHIASARNIVLSIGQTDFSRYFNRVANYLKDKKSASRMMLISELGMDGKKSQSVIDSMLLTGKLVPSVPESFGNRTEPRYELNPYTTEREICEYEAMKTKEVSSKQTLFQTQAPADGTVIPFPNMPFITRGS